MMFAILMVCYCSVIFSEYSCDTKSHNLTCILSWESYYISDEIVHTIFAIKYWVLSRKINQLVSNKEDKYLDCKARLIFLLQMLLILFTSIAWSLVYIVDLTNKGYETILVFYTLNPYISFVILAEAFWKLKSCGADKYSLSSRQIAIQLIAGLAYAFSTTLFYIIPNS